MSEVKSYPPQKIRRVLVYLFKLADAKPTRKGNPAADAFLRKPSPDEVIAFLNDGTDFDNVKWFVGHKKEYRQTFQAAFMRRYGLNHADSIKAVNPILKVLDNSTYTQAQKIAYCENYLTYAHESDKAQLQARLEAKLGTITPVASSTAASPELPHKRGVMRLSANHVKLAPHMVRAAKILSKLSPDWSETALIRLYFIIRHIDTWRDGKGDGKTALNYVTFDELRAFLKSAGIYTRESFNRWLHDGVEAGYWTIARNKARLHYTGIKPLADMLMQCLPDDVLPDFIGNQAIGERMVWVDIRGGIATFEGRVLGAWIAEHEHGENGVTIQNRKIADMWHVSVRCVQYWRKAADIPHIANYAETEDPELPIKRKPNTYFAPDDTREHSHTGQSRRVRQIANRELSRRGFNPDSDGDVGQVEHLRIFFHDSQNRKGEITTAFQHIDNYRNKIAIPPGMPQYALKATVPTKAGVVGLYQEVI